MLAALGAGRRRERQGAGLAEFDSQVTDDSGCLGPAVSQDGELHCWSRRDLARLRAAACDGDDYGLDTIGVGFLLGIGDQVSDQADRVRDSAVGSGAGRICLSDRVSERHLRRVTPAIPWWRITSATRLRLTLPPMRRSSACICGTR